MPRILLLILLIWILYVVLKRFIAFTKKNKPSTSKPSNAENIVACHQCGLHIPENEAHTIDSDVYCNNPDCHPPN